MKETDSLSGLLNVLEKETQGKSRIELGTLISHLDRRSHGIALLVPALMGASPLGAVPGLPSILALMTAIVAVQFLFGNDGIWLPDAISRKTVPVKKVPGWCVKLKPFGVKFDKIFNNQGNNSKKNTLFKLSSFIIIILCILIPPLEFLPLVALFPFASILTIALSIIMNNLFLLFAGYLMSLASLATPIIFGVQ